MALKINWWTLSLVIFLALLLYQKHVFANGCTVGSDGDLIVPIQNEDVKMVSEKVTVNLSGSTKQAECIFRLRNLTNRELSFRMGFPLSGDADSYQSKSFRVFSSQKELASEEIIQRAGSLKPYPSVMRVWTMYFPPEADRIVRCTYPVAMSEGGSEIGDPFPSDFSSFYYITRTGALWKGPIDTADFKIILPWSTEDLTPGGERRVVSITPGGHNWEGYVVTWRFENWEPDADIYILRESYNLIGQDTLSRLVTIREVIKGNRYSGYVGDKKIYTEEDVAFGGYRDYRDAGDRWLVGQDYELVQKLCISYLRNEILARHGYRFKNRNWQKIFFKEKWFKPQEHFSMSLLNGIEKKNLEFLTQYEKQRGWR